MSGAHYSELDAQGLNLQAVFRLTDLPPDLRQQLPPGAARHYRQLLLIGHRGRRLWQQVQQARLAGPDPIDRFTRAQVHAWLQRHHPGVRHAWLYPGDGRIGLQRLGALAGWHHDSPFKLGIHTEWGSWFAYRAALLLDTDLPPSTPLASAPPCSSCASRACVAACPAGALQPDFDLQACIGYRLRPGSACARRCLARNACPLGADARYSDEQIAYHYAQSLAMLAAFQASNSDGRSR